MELTDKELEDRLKDVGIRLASPPSAVDELLRLLDQTEIYLSRVEQSPSTSMSDALCPAMNTLVTKEYLNHSETDVKVFVAACINEITRITAPDAPYNDSLMKEIFAVIVGAFGKLDDISGPSYSKRVSILETVAKVRSCVVMLDLECDDLILQMFKHFLNCIRPDHSINVFSSMETIMTLVLEDSEDISQELLHCLLSNVHNSKKDVMPVACRLAEKVISNCAVKLKPYLLVAVKSLGTVLSDYGDVVTSICHECSVAPVQNEADESKLCARMVPDDLPQNLDKSEPEGGNFTDKARKVLSNGVVPFENGNPITEINSPEFKPDNSFSEQCKNVIGTRGENNNLGSVTDKPSNELDLKYAEAKSSSVQLTDASDSSRVDGDKEASSPTIRRVGRKRKTKSSIKSDGASDMLPETEVLLEPKKAVELRPPEGLVGDSARAIPVVTSDNLPNCDPPKMDEAARSQFSAKRSTTHKPPSAGKKKKSRNTKTDLKGSLTIVSEHGDQQAVGNSDGKQSQDSTKKSLEDNDSAIDVDTAVICDESLMKEQKESTKKVAMPSSSRKHMKSSIKQSKIKDIAEGDVSADRSLKEMLVPSKDSRVVSDGEPDSGKLIETSSRKKRRRKTSGWKIYTGRRIQVWWPDDEMYYKGVITEFDPVTERHKVLYDDGDVELLFLANERWNYVDSNDHENGKDNDLASPEPSVQVPKKPRGSSGKNKATPETDKSVGEFKGSPTQQSRRGKSAVKSRGSYKQESSKAETSPIIEKTPGNDGSKVEQSPAGKSVVKSRGRSKSQTSKVDTLPDEKTPVSDTIKVDKSHGQKTSSKSRHEPKQETSKESILPEQKTPSTDGTKVEQSHGTKLVAKSRGGRQKKEPSEVAPSLTEKTPAARGGDGDKVEEPHDEKSEVKSRGRVRQKTSKVSTSPVKNTPAKFDDESSQKNKSKNVSTEDNSSKKVNSDETNKLPSGVGKSVIRSRRRSKGENDPETAAEVTQPNASADVTPLQNTSVVKDGGVLTAVKLGMESEGKSIKRRGRKSALKSRRKPKTSSISTQTDNIDDLPTDTPGSIISEKLEQKNPVESSKDVKVRGKRKETAPNITEGTPHSDASAIKISGTKEGDDSVARADVGMPKKSAGKSNKRRRRK